MAMTIEPEREAFEKWVAKRHGVSTERWADSGKYKYDNTNAWWECWQASQACLTQPAQAVDAGALRELNEWLLAQEGMHVDPDHVAEAITRALAGEKADGWRVPEVTFDMVRVAEHFCPTDLPHLDKLRWKARKLSELLAAPTPPTDGEE